MRQLLLIIIIISSGICRAQNNAWFSFFKAHDSTICTGALVPNYPDSTLYMSVAGTSYYWPYHGLGVSFDPTSQWFDSLWNNNTAPPPPFIVTDSDAYTVDAFEIQGLYHRTNNSYPPDTLYMDVCYAPSVGAYKYKTGPLDSFFHITTGDESFDSFVRAALPYYDRNTNSISPTYTTGVMRITKILDGAAAVDTQGNGISDWIFNLPTAMNVPAGGKVILFTHFASSYAYALGTPLENGNYWQDVSYDLGVTPEQGTSFPYDTSDYNIGIVCRTAERYNMNATYLYGSIPSLYLSYCDGIPHYMHDPYAGFHIGCPTCKPNPFNNGVKPLAKNIYTTVYPNPVNDVLHISYMLSQPDEATVSIINIFGQKVSTQHVSANVKSDVIFNTVTMPAGTYFYTISTSTQKDAGTVIVAH